MRVHNIIFLCLTINVWPVIANGDEAVIAVATNFSEALEILVADFESSNKHELAVVSGATGKLYAQIVNGAPFDVFLAADSERPRLLVENGAAIPGSRITYAIGRLTLWSSDETLIGVDGGEVVRNGNYRRLAMANPTLAPYGTAARDTLESLGVYEALRGRIAIGENVGQAWAMIATGNAELGLVALSYVLSPRNDVSGSRWDVPQNFYTPIRQDAVLLRRARDNVAAKAFLDWMKQPRTKSMIKNYGYSVE